MVVVGVGGAKCGAGGDGCAIVVSDGSWKGMRKGG